MIGLDLRNSVRTLAAMKENPIALSPDRRFLEIVPELPNNFPAPVLAEPSKTPMGCNRSGEAREGTQSVGSAVICDRAAQDGLRDRADSRGGEFTHLSDAELYEQAMSKQAEEVAAFERAERVRKQASAGRWTGSRSPFASN